MGINFREMFGKIFLFFVIFVNGSQAIQLGHCPFVRTQTDFNASDFLGVWYEYAKYPIVTEALSKCIQLEFGQLPNETISVVRTVTGNLSQAQIGFTGQAVVIEPGVLELSGNGLAGILGNETIYVLGTDYSNYAVIFSCHDLLNIGVVHEEYAFLLTRERKPGQEVLSVAQNALKSNGLSVRNLKVTNQRNCPQN